jgi:CBS domain-containing protein
LEDVLRRFAKKPSLQAIFVTGEADQLIGTISRSDLLRWVRMHQGTLSDATTRGADRARQLAACMRAAVARDTIGPGTGNTAVRVDDSVDSALSIMLDLDLSAIPVVDVQGGVIGDLSLSQVLRYLLKERREDHWAEVARTEQLRPGY